METIDHAVILRKKIIPLAELIRLVGIWRLKADKVVFTNGCFDVLHHGHIELLAHCKNQGQRLIVALNTDDSVRRLKGPSRPVNAEDNRAFNLAAIGMVDAVILFPEDSPLDIIRALKPDVLVKGGDYSEDQIVGAADVKAYGGKVAIFPLVKDQSTTGLVEKIKGL